MRLDKISVPSYNKDTRKCLLVTSTPLRWNPGRLPQTHLVTHAWVYAQEQVSCLVAVDGSLFFILGLYVDIDGKRQSDDTTNTSNNVQNVHISYLLGIISREARYSPSFPRSRVVRQPSFTAHRLVSTRAVGFHPLIIPESWRMSTKFPEFDSFPQKTRRKMVGGHKTVLRTPEEA